VRTSARLPVRTLTPGHPERDSGGARHHAWYPAGDVLCRGARRTCHRQL